MAAVNDPYAYVDADDDYVKVSQGENADFMEFPKENDGTIMFSTIQAQFEETIGLKYKSSSGAWRAIRAVDNVLAPPKGGWGDRVYCIAVTGEVLFYIHKHADMRTHTHMQTRKYMQTHAGTCRHMQAHAGTRRHVR